MRNSICHQRSCFAETIYTMAAVKEITPDNIQAIGKTGKDVVDYITDQIDKVVNNKDKKENK